MQPYHIDILNGNINDYDIFCKSVIYLALS